ncbi:MAG: hypothetical protein WC802_04160 [Patescibacteria group bacterium]|jgi:hypothetical protein
MKELSGGEGAAYVIAVSMGYGHERAASALRGFAEGRKVIVANEYEGIPKGDKKLWDLSRRWYERISRFKKVPIVGPMAFGVMDWIQQIEPFYPRRDLSAPTMQLRQTYALIRRSGWCRHLIEELAKKPKPLVCTFMTAAFAAEENNYPGDIFLVCCDADVARPWAPLNPYKSRIQYLAPTGRVAERLKLYGVRSENIHLTGFPLPPEAVGGPESKQALEDLSRRMCHLDPQGIFMEQAAPMLEAKMGSQFCSAVKKGNGKAVSLTFAIGGAGAQREMGVTAACSLAQSILAGKLQMNLVAGIRPEVGEYFRTQLAKCGLGDAVQDGRVNIIENKDRQEYFSSFNKLMMKTDILWTKPSELSFYAGLGIPILMAPTVGSQEDFNRQWLFQVGAGVKALDPRYADEWLWDWINGGAFARMAWNGYINAPTHGAYRIEDVVRGRPFTMHQLPIVV